MHQVPDSDGRWEAGRLALTPPSISTAEDDGYLVTFTIDMVNDRSECVVLDAARPGVDQAAVTGTKSKSVGGQVVSGYTLQHHGRGRIEIDIFGHHHQPVGRDGHSFGI